MQTTDKHVAVTSLMAYTLTHDKQARLAIMTSHPDPSLPRFCMSPVAISRRLSGPLRVLHQRILISFLHSGAPPLQTTISAYTRQLGLDESEALNDLSTVGLIHLNPVSLNIMAAVPFPANLHDIKSDWGTDKRFMHCVLSTPQEFFT